MKKFLLPLVILAFLTSCKKNNKVTETTYEADSTVVIPETNEPADNIILTEYSPDQVSELLNRKNDTLYVTNFFATWCGPCVRELPHFREKMDELKGKPVKFTFVSLDQKSDWEAKVKEFGDAHGITQQIILLDGMALAPDFMTKNFSQWDGGSIPFTFMRKGDKTDETVGMMTKDELERKLNSFN